MGSVEFEADVACFFDASASKRTTGSLILIDPARNATVGAGMIQEEVAATGIAGEPKNELATSAADEIPVALEERYARNGHFPGVVLLERRAALAERLERLLFDLGFEILSLSRPEITSDNFPDALRGSNLAALLTLYSPTPLTTPTHHP